MTKIFSWDELISEIAKHVPSSQFKAWLATLRFIEITESHLVLGVPTAFHRDWIYDHYREVVIQCLMQLYKLQREIQIEVFLSMPSVELPIQTDSENQILSVDKSASIEEEPIALAEESDSLNHKGFQKPIHSKAHHSAIDVKHRFETFIVGSSNQFAHAAARAVSENPAGQYNPLFIYSGAGLGKTHLLNAIANYLLQTNPNRKVHYISAEHFVNELIESLRYEKMIQFRQKYRDSYDILLLDDIQFIAGKDKSQEEFFHTFNALHSSRRQIVVSSDKSPNDIPKLEERIRTRFQWGLIADIAPPEIETRIAILRAKAEHDDIFLPNDVALFLATNIKHNIRELEGALLRLGALADLSGREIDLALAKQDLSAFVKQPLNTVSVDAIQEAVAHRFGLNVSDLRSKERSRKVTLPRQVTMYLIRKYTGRSFPEIGILMGGKDHSTVMHGVNYIEKALKKDSNVKEHVEAIKDYF